jgi:hypothetical protein
MQSEMEVSRSCSSLVNERVCLQLEEKIDGRNSKALESAILRRGSSRGILTGTARTHLCLESPTQRGADFDRSRFLQLVFPLRRAVYGTVGTVGITLGIRIDAISVTISLVAFTLSYFPF